MRAFGMIRIAALILAFGALRVAHAADVQTPAPVPPWHGRAAHRVIVRVDPVELADARQSDVLVASYDLDLADFKSDIAPDRAVDFDSLQVVRFAHADGSAQPYADNVYASTEFDIPFQFYDATYPEQFPDYERYLSHQAAAPFLRPKLISYGARQFNAVGAGRKGKLSWPHTQTGRESSWYAVYFDLEPAGAVPKSPPSGFIGDGSNRVVRESPRFGPPGNINGRAVDWNGDGLPDMLFGGSDGHLTLYLNGGVRGAPSFRTKQLLLDDRDVPIDVGFSSSPFAVDWNGDGRRDLVVGAEKGCVVWFENHGTDDAPSFRFAGFIESEGRMILTPAKPIAEGRGEEVFKEDYFPVPLVVDWDADSDLDLLLGGYVTGLTFYYENTAGPGKMPELKPRGPLADADGQTIDTGWQAAPAAADLDADRDLDVVFGGKPISLGGGDVSDPNRAVFYYENVGTAKAPRLAKKTFPADGPPPYGGMGVPSFADWDGDRLKDLVVVDARQRLFPFRNIGTVQSPKFDLKSPALTGQWQSEGLFVGSFADVNGDGNPDALNGFNVFLSDGRPSPRFFPRRISFTAGKVIKHEVPYGDENPGLILCDLNGDGVLDGLYGAHGGYLWFHENRGSNAKPDLDVAGRRLLHPDGKPLKVGLPEGATIEKFDFNVLQGARARPVAADFNRDGLVDLVVGDTYGKVRYFENVGSKKDPVFAAPVLVDDRKSRLFVSTLDWNGDGAADLVVLKSGVHVFVNKNVPGRCEFLPPEKIELPATQGYLLSLCAVDWNRDGDEDLMYTAATGDLFFAERSFLKHGYLPAQRQAFERRKD